MIDNVRAFLTEMGRTPLLTAAEEIALAKLIQAQMQVEALPAENRPPNFDQIVSAGKRAKDRMVKANLRLVVNIAKKYQHRGLEFLDLIQEGSLGVVRAAEKFDPAKGYKFSTYAYWWIRQAITRAIADASRTIRLPIHVTEKLNKIKKTTKTLSQQLGRSPTYAELADALNMSEKTLREIVQSSQRPFSLDITQRNDDDDHPLLSRIAAPEQTNSREQEMVDVVRVLLENAPLTDRERQIIQYRRFESMTLEEIGIRLSMSRERVRQLENKGMNKLRNRAKGVIDPGTVRELLK